MRGQLQSTTRRLNKHWQSGGGGHVTPTIDFITVSGPHIPSGLDVKFQAINLPRQFTRGFRPTDDKPNIEFILRPFSAFYEQPGVPSSHRDRTIPDIYIDTFYGGDELLLYFQYRGNTYSGVTHKGSVPSTRVRYETYRGPHHDTYWGYGPVSAGGYIIFTADLRTIFGVQTLSQLQENVYLTGISRADSGSPFDYGYSRSDNPSNTTVNYSLTGRLVA